MLELKLTKTGKLTMENGHIHIEGFEADGAMCREVAALSLLWAIGIMQNELTELIARPGGTGNTSVD